MFVVIRERHISLHYQKKADDYTRETSNCFQAASSFEVPLKGFLVPLPNLRAIWWCNGKVSVYLCKCTCKFFTMSLMLLISFILKLGTHNSTQIIRNIRTFFTRFYYCIRILNFLCFHWDTYTFSGLLIINWVFHSEILIEIRYSINYLLKVLSLLNPPWLKLRLVNCHFLWIPIVLSQRSSIKLRWEDYQSSFDSI